MKQWDCMLPGEPCVVSFSGGKDSVFALHRAALSGRVLGVIAMLEETGTRSGAHGLSGRFLKRQAEAMGLEIWFGKSNWKEYEQEFTRLLKEFRQKGAQALVTGDMDLPEENCWHERVAESAGLEFRAPLWRMDHTREAFAFVEAGFTSVVVSIRESAGLRKEDLGRVFDGAFIQDMIARGIDPSGEGGEFHTAVVDGPLFHRRVKYKEKERFTMGQYLLMEIEAV
jgi:diphthine-ammonia ligase